MTSMETNLPYLERDEDRHGNPRVYVRRNGKRIRIRAKEGTSAFASAYSEALAGLEARSSSAPALMGHAKGTLGWLGSRYFASREFAGIAKESQRARRNCLVSGEWFQYSSAIRDWIAADKQNRMATSNVALLRLDCLTSEITTSNQ